MNKLMNKLLGSVTFRIEGGRGEAFLNDCAQNGIPLQNIRPMALGFCAQVPLRYYLRLHRMARRRRCRLKACDKTGLYFTVRLYRNRWGIAAGAIIAMALLWVCPRLVWTVQFYDFTPKEQVVLRKQLYDSGICEGSMPSRAELKQTEASLFVENQAYSWVKLNLIDGKLVCEKVDATQPPAMEQDAPAAIVAKCDGIIEWIDADGGYIERYEGQSVAEGDTIISAVHMGRTGKLHTQRASARVYASIERIYEASQSLTVKASVPSLEYTSQYAVYAFGKTFPLSFLSSKPQAGESTVLRTPLTFFGLPLPATVLCTQYRNLKETELSLTPEQAADLARDRIYTAMKTEFPDLVLRSKTEDVVTDNGMLTLRMKIEARADIAQLVENWNA